MNITQKSLIKAMQDLKILPQGNYYRAWKKRSVIDFIDLQLSKDAANKIFLAATNGDYTRDDFEFYRDLKPDSVLPSKRSVELSKLSPEEFKEVMSKHKANDTSSLIGRINGKL